MDDEVTGSGAIVVEPDPVVMKLVAFAPTILLKSNFWYNWAQIAVEHEHETRAHRAAAKRSWPDAGQTLVYEMHAAMVTIAAVAFAVDALHADIAPLVGRNPDPSSGRGKQWGYAAETFRQASPALGARHDDFRWLARLRRDAVHFAGEQHSPVPHPELPTNVSQQNIDFSWSPPYAPSIS